MIRILLVEDEPASGEYLQSIVEKFLPGATVVGLAENGAEALEILENQECDAVISDICMPRMDGLELARILRERWPGVYMVIVSGYEKFEYAKAAMRYGVSDYLLKPVKPAELTACIGRLSESIESKNRANRSPISDSMQEPTDADGDSSNNQKFRAVQAYLEAHLSHPLSLDKVCRALNMSQASLNRLFRTCVNMSFVEYLKERRMEMAKQLILRDPDCRLKEIAAQVGFSDALYFSRVFRQYTGYPPSEYARRSKEK